MVYPFNYPSQPGLLPLTPSIEIGAYFGSGLRIGPAVSADPQPSTTLIQPNQTIPTQLMPGPGSQRNLSDAYGPGMLVGSLATYRINPVTGLGSGGVIGQLTGIGAGAASVGQSITLQNNDTNPRCVNYFLKADGITPGILLDVPRTVRANITGLTSGQPTTMTIRVQGLDFYYQKLTADIVIDQTPSGTSLYQESLSAFSVVYSATVTAANVSTGGNATLKLNAGQTFGLPYRLDSMGHVFGYSQWSVSQNPSEEPTSQVDFPNEVSYLFPTSLQFVQTTQAQAPIPFGEGIPQAITPGLVTTGTPATATTNDVRGLIAPQTTFTVTVDNASPYGYAYTLGDDYQFAGPFTVMYYAPGADYLQYQQKSQLAVFMNGIQYQSLAGFGKSNLLDSPMQNPTVEDLFGVLPYFSG
jgi:hypothetical protein